MTGCRAPLTRSAAPADLSGFCTPQARPFLLIAAILASSLGFIDGTVVAIAMPAIRRALDATLAQAQWVHNAYILTLCAFMLAGGAMADRFGLARVFGGGIALFVVASMACAMAPGPETLIMARAVQGLGAAVMVPGSMALVARAYPRAERGRAIGIWAAASAMTTALGPVIGGLALSFGDDAMWRWIFAVNLPMGAIALALLAGRVRPDPGAPGTPVDWTGAGLATAALFALAWGLTGVQEGAGAAVVWLGVGLAGLGLFGLHQTRAAAPMVPPSVVSQPVFAAVNLMSFALYSALSMMLFYMPMTVIAGWGRSELMASLLFAPLSVFISAMSAHAGRWADRIGPAPLLATGSLVVAAGYALAALAARAQMFFDGLLPAMCLVGVGMALVVAPLSATVLASVEETRSGLASGINNAVTRLAGLISVAAAGGLVAAGYAAAQGPASFGVASAAPGHADAMSRAFATLAWAASGLSLLSAALAWALVRPRMGPAGG